MCNPWNFFSCHLFWLLRVISGRILIQFVGGLVCFTCIILLRQGQYNAVNVRGKKWLFFSEKLDHLLRGKPSRIERDTSPKLSQESWNQATHMQSKLLLYQVHKIQGFSSMISFKSFPPINSLAKIFLISEVIQQLSQTWVDLLVGQKFHWYLWVWMIFSASHMKDTFQVSLTSFFLFWILS